MNEKTKSKKYALRVGHYNIYQGAKNKVQEIFALLENEDIDVCGILEAVDWQNEFDVIKEMATAHGYFFIDVSTANSKYNIAVVSRYDLDVTAIRTGFQHVVTKVTLSEFEDLEVFFIHLSPRTEKDRLQEVERLLSLVDAQKPSIIMGDFNSLSLDDPYNHAQLLKDLNTAGVVRYGVDALHFDVIKKIKQSGFIDSMSRKDNLDCSTPTPSNSDYTHSVPVRIDYAFLNSQSSRYLHSVRLIKNDTTNRLSDHYPLVIELRK